MAGSRPIPHIAGILLAALALAALAAPMVAAQAPGQREALRNPGLEGDATVDNGFTFIYGGDQVGAPDCAAATTAGQVRSGDCAVDLGVAGIDQQDHLPYTGLRFPLPYGNRLADFEGFSAYLNVTDPVTGVPGGARLHYFFRFASTGVGPADRCANSGTLVPIGPATTGWQYLDLLGPSTNVYGDSAASDCFGAPGGVGDTLATLKARYPNAEIRTLYVQLEGGQASWTGTPNSWPADTPVHLDDFSALFKESETVLVWEGSGLDTSEDVPTPDTYQVRLAKDPGATVTVTPSEVVAPGGTPQLQATSPGAVTFTGGASGNWRTWQDVTVTPVDDFLAEARPHNATLRHSVSSSPPSAYSAALPASLTVRIDDDDVPGIVQSPDELALDERDVTVTKVYGITLGTQPLPGETVTVTVTPDAQTQVDTDLSTPFSYQNTIQVTSANWASQPFQVRVFVVDDAIDEDDPHRGSINATTSSNVPTSAYNTAPNNRANTVNVTIGDNDPTVSVAWAADAVEGGAPGAFTITRGPDSARDITFNFTIAGTADEGPLPDDYTLLLVGPATMTYSAGAGTMLVPAGTTTATLQVWAFSEPRNEVTETVILTLNTTDCSCSTDPAKATATVRIIDVDQPTVRIEWVQDAYEADPGAPVDPNGSFRLTRDDANLHINVTYALTGSALASHYTLSDPSPVHFVPGQDVAYVNVTAIDNDADNVFRTVTATLQPDPLTPFTYEVALSPDDTATLKIIGNDRPTAWVVATVNATSEDPDAPLGVVTLRRTDGHVADEPLTVYFRMGGTATPGSDYPDLGADASPPPGLRSVTFPIGDNVTTFVVNADPDGINEVTETAILALEPDAPDEPLNPERWYLLNATLGASATVTIEDFDPTIVCITDASDAREHYVTDGTFVLTRIRPDLAIDVSYTVSGIAHTGRYELNPASPVHFNAGQDTVTITVRMPDDHVTDGDGTLTLTLVDGAAYDVCAPPGDARSITLFDNEDAAVSVTSATDATEGSIVGVYTLTRDDPDKAISVQYALAGTASPSDYAAAPVGTVSFAAGQAVATVTITAPNGDGDENTEDLTLTIVDGGLWAPFYHLGATPSGTLDILDADLPNIAPDGFFAFNDCAVTIPARGVLANDNPPPGKVYTATPWNGSTAQSGKVFVNEDGSLLYRPAPGFLGTDQFQYNNTDGTDTSPSVLVTMTVLANSLPVADFTTSTTMAQVGQVVTFKDASSDGEGPITGWVWDFGDGAGALGPQATHAFNRGGTFQVRLTVLDGQCASGVAEATIHVGFPPNLAPQQPGPPGGGMGGAAGPGGGGTTANPYEAQAGPDQTVLEGASVVLQGSVSGAGPGATVLYRWTQEKGETVALTAAGNTASFKAPRAGATGQVLQFRLDATVDGAEAVPSRVLVTIVATNHAPVARLVAVPAAAPGETVTLDATTSTDADGDTLTFTFDQVDGVRAPLETDGVGVAQARMPDTQGALQFRVRVSDGRTTTSETVVVQVRLPPAEATPPEVPTEKSTPSAQLAASANLAWAWWTAGLLAAAALVVAVLLLRRRRA
jgi:hypothetical protein